MSESAAEESAARKRVTERCLIAADVDKTILVQAPGERDHFLHRVAPQLLDSAKLGMKLAFVTGNSMSQLTDRFLKWLLEHLSHTNDLTLLPQFHFFCNSGGVYFHFPKNHDAIAKFLANLPANKQEQADQMLDILTSQDEQLTRFVRPEFVDANYLERTRIPKEEVSEIRSVLEECGESYLKNIKSKASELKENYDLSAVERNGALQPPAVDMRHVEYFHQTDSRLATVQLTLKPILSFRHGVTEAVQAQLFENDLRTEMIADVQQKLDESNLSQYIARPGGRSSIDVTLEKLDKAYAMEFLIDRLNLQGHSRRRQRFGANAIYLGDEVIVGGGNDYAVTRLPGLLVFAVNSERSLIPFLSHVFVPSSILEGPEATTDVLSELNKIARNALALAKGAEKTRSGILESGTAIDEFKVKVFGERIHDKIAALKMSGKLTPDEWQILHAFVTLMHRDDASARHWLAILVDELDAIMTQLSEFPNATRPAIGTSHPDN